MKEALRIYYGHVLPGLWRERRLGAILVFGCIFHVGPLVARPGSDPWEQPLVYANF